MNIREANINDLDALCKIENECFKSPYKRSDIEYELTKNPINKYLVIEDKEIVGFIDYMITFNSSTINQIAISSSYRRKGLARKLLEAMVNSFPKDIEDIVETITLEVRKSNEAAIKLYESFGFEKITIKKGYYNDGEDAVYYVKRVI